MFFVNSVVIFLLKNKLITHLSLLRCCALGHITRCFSVNNFFLTLVVD